MTLRVLCFVSGLYDLAIGVSMLLAANLMARLFGAAPPSPLLNAQLNGVFALAIGVGYFWAARDPEGRRGYLWVAGVLAKSLGAIVFVIDHFTQGSPRTFLLFAFTDGALAAWTAIALLSTRRSGTASVPPRA